MQKPTELFTVAVRFEKKYGRAARFLATMPRRRRRRRSATVAWNISMKLLLKLAIAARLSSRPNCKRFDGKHRESRKFQTVNDTSHWRCFLDDGWTPGRRLSETSIIRRSIIRNVDYQKVHYPKHQLYEFRLSERSILVHRISRSNLAHNNVSVLCLIIVYWCNDVQEFSTEMVTRW